MSWRKKVHETCFLRHHLSERVLKDQILKVQVIDRIYHVDQSSQSELVRVNSGSGLFLIS